MSEGSLWTTDDSSAGVVVTDTDGGRGGLADIWGHVDAGKTLGMEFVSSYQHPSRYQEE